MTRDAAYATKRLQLMLRSLEIEVDQVDRLVRLALTSETDPLWAADTHCRLTILHRVLTRNLWHLRFLRNTQTADLPNPRPILEDRP